MAEQDKELNITAEELEKIQNALKNEEFRKMFVEYAKEISDPENRKKYETEIAQMEAERGMDVKFINLQDGFVIKTSMESEGGKKAFINICKSDAVQVATSHFVDKKINSQSTPGHQWAIPYSLNQPKDDTDKAGKKCVVYDVVFNPKTYQMGMEDARFKKLMMNTSFDAIEDKWKIKLDRKNLKFPKMKFKGSKQQTIIRIPNNKATKEPGADIDIGGHLLPYPYKENIVKNEPEYSSSIEPAKIKQESSEITPKYTIVHRGHLDLQNFTNARDCRASTRPKELVINIDLPLCKSAAGIDLDIFEKQLILDSSDPLYHLEITLPYPIIEEEGGAKFDKSKRRLIVTLIVQPCPAYEVNKTEENGLVEEFDNCAATGDNGLVKESKDSSETEDNQPVNHPVLEDCLTNGVQKSFGKNNNNLGNEDYNECDCTEKKTGDECVEDSVITTENDKGDTKDRGIEENGAESVTKDHGMEEMVGCSEDSYPSIRDQTIGISCPFFQPPPYSYHQDTNTVTFVLHVPNVAIETVSLGFNENKCAISFPSSMTSPPSLSCPGYALYMQFPDDCVINSETSKIDSNESNLVLVLHKDENHEGLWDYFMIGSHEDKLEKKLFVTQENLEKSLKECEDYWVGQTVVTSKDITTISEDEIRIELGVEQKGTGAEKMGNILAQADDDLVADDMKYSNETKANSENIVTTFLRTTGILSGKISGEDEEQVKVPGIEVLTGRDPGVKTPGAKVPGEKVPGGKVPGVEVPGVGLPGVKTPGVETPGVKIPVGDGDDGFVVVSSEVNAEEQGCHELPEVEVIEEKYEDYEDNFALSTVQEVGNTNPANGGDIELQRARVIKCKKNRRRRRRSTGSHESSSISEEEGEPGAGRKLRGKQARRLRKTRSLSLGSSTESHDDADGCHSNDGPRSVRFNLVPEVHVFSNKSDKKKWKEIRRQHLPEPGNHNGFLPGKSALKDSNGATEKTQNDEDEVFENLDESVDGDTSCKVEHNDVDGKPQLTNTLIFDLDD